MDKDEKEIEKYKIAIELLKFDGEMLWKIMSAYMIVNTIFLGFISQNIKDYTLHFEPVCFIAGIFGLILIIPWLGTFMRNSDYYNFRMAQAKKVEPKEWNLLNSKAEKFAEGEKVTLKETNYQISFLGRCMKNKKAVYWVIAVFGLIYISMIICFGPWWNLCWCK